MQDPGNLGALARVAEAAGAAGLALSPGSAHPNHPRALRASAGSLLRLPVAVGVEAAALDRRLAPVAAHAGWPWSPRDGQDLWAAALDGALVLALGAEGPGLSPAPLARADLRLTIPVEPPVESLNATVAGGARALRAGAAATRAKGATSAGGRGLIPRAEPSPLLPMTSILPTMPSALLALAGCLLLAACGASEAQRQARLPPASNLLLVTVDTLRADHLSSWGYPRPTSPVIDRLAAEGVRFAQASVQWPKTGPSFASMFTSTYGKDNGIVRKVGVPLPCRFETLAEVLREHGYATHAVVSNGAVGSEFDFDQGFDTYLETWKVAAPEASGADPTGAERVNRLALGLLDRLERDRRRPWFLWVHYLDPHWPYRPPRERWDHFQGDEHFDPAVHVPVATGKDRQEMGGMGERQVELGRTELAFYVARYDAEIAYVDAKLGELLAEMRRRGLLERTLTAFTADHGESLGDHDYYFEHGRFGFQSCLHVPLVLHYPGVLAPRVDPRPVELIDLAPTLLEAAGVELSGGVWRQGRSLLPRLFGETTDATDDLVFSEAGYETRGKWQKIVRDGHFKLVYAQTRPEQRWIGGPGVRFTLYDLASDPGETVNVAAEHPAEVERLTRALWAWDRAPRFEVEVEPPSAECEERPMEKETEELLRSLGYL